MKKYYSEIRVIYADTDAMGIVYHGNYIKWFEIGRCEFLRQIGFPYSELEKDGLWLPVTSVTCDYKKPGLYDDVLRIATWVDKLGGASFIMKYEIRRKSTDELLVAGTSKHAITDETLKPIRLKKKNMKLYEAIIKDMDD